MILSLSHNFIFVHIPKTAGSALHAALLPYARPVRRTLLRSALRRLPIVEAPESAHFRIHERATSIRKKLSPAVYAQFHSFAVVRNPFDHAVSHYEYMKQYRSARIARRAANTSFEEYLERRLKGRKVWQRLFVNLPDQAYFVVGSDGKLVVDRIMRFETLERDFAVLATDLGLDNPQLERRNPTLSRSKMRQFDAYYDANTKEMVCELYARDFELFSYPREVE